VYDIIVYTLYSYYTFRSIIWPSYAISIIMDEYIVITQRLSEKKNRDLK